MSYTLQQTINWARTFVQYAPLTAGVGNELAVSIANEVVSTITSAPWTWPWNRGEYTGLVLQTGVQDYSVPINDFGFLEKTTLITADGKYAYEIKDVYNTATLGVSISDFAEPKAVCVNFAPGYGNGFSYGSATSVDTATIVSSSIVNISAALLGVGSVSGSISQYIPCATVTADQVVAAEYGDILKTFVALYTANNNFPPGIPIRVSGTTRQGGDLNITGFNGFYYYYSPTTTVQIHNVSGISLLANGSDTGMICPLITTDQPFSNPSASGGECFSDVSNLSLNFGPTTYPVAAGSLMTFVCYLISSSAYVTVSSIADTLDNTWYPLAPVVEFINSDGVYSTYQVFYALANGDIPSGGTYSFTGSVVGAATVGGEFTLTTWNNVGAPIGSPTTSTVGGGVSTLPLGITTTQTAAVLAFTMGSIVTDLPSSFYTTANDFGACQFFWANPSTLSMVAPPGTYDPTFNLYSSAYLYGSVGVMSAFAIT